MLATRAEARSRQGAAAVERSWLDRMLRTAVREEVSRRVARRREGQRRPERLERRPRVGRADCRRRVERQMWRWVGPVDHQRQAERQKN